MNDKLHERYANYVFQSMQQGFVVLLFEDWCDEQGYTINGENRKSGDWENIHDVN